MRTACLAVILATVLGGHPECRDLGAPKPYDYTKAFCNAKGPRFPWKPLDGTCCSKEEDKTIGEDFGARLVLLPEDVPDQALCVDLLKVHFCARCNPYASYLFTTAFSKWPVVCPEFAREFRAACGDAIADSVDIPVDPGKHFFCSPFSPIKYNNSTALPPANETALEPAFPKLKGKLPKALTGAHLVPGGSSNSKSWWVVSQAGVIVEFDDDEAVTKVTTVLNISDRVAYTHGGEEGLLGLAFSPDFAGFSGNSFFYLNYITAGDKRRTRISRFKRTTAAINFFGDAQGDAATAAEATAASEEVIMAFEQPFSNNNGGWIGFGPDDKMLYISVGDGGGRFDPQGDAQNTSRLLGKILRIDVEQHVPPGVKYTWPGDNPYQNEVWASGLRNPWRCNFNPSYSLHLWCGDVGQGAQEEVNAVYKGGNYGWSTYDGNVALDPKQDWLQQPPVYSYCHDVSDQATTLCSVMLLGRTVIGGMFYRGGRYSKQLTGNYIFGDYKSKRLGAVAYNASTNAYQGRALLAVDIQFSAFAEGSNREMLLVAHNFDEPGMLYHFKCGPSCNETGITGMETIMGSREGSRR